LLARLQLRHRAWRYRRRVDPEGIGWMVARLAGGDTAIDVGAYKGGYTYWMRRAVGAHGLVLAFEPQPEAAYYLQSYVEAFGWANVLAIESAVSSAPGQRVLLRPGAGASPAASLEGVSLPPEPCGTAVMVDTIDRRLARHAAGRRLRFLKCDVEGHELEVFRGGESALREHHPAILVECEVRHLRGLTVHDVFAHLAWLGYRGSFFLGGRAEDVSRFDPSVHQVEGRRPYVNNFAFEWHASS
jgi:FkbM family methyltransferase